MPVNQLIYQGVVFTLVQEARGWTAFLSRFGRTMYFSSRDEAIDEAIRLIEAFQAPRLLRQAG